MRSDPAAAMAVTAKTPSTAVVYTTAPAAYDWWFTREVGVAGRVGVKVARRVEVEAGRVEEQCARYSSGLHMVADEAEWTKLVAYGLAEPLADADRPSQDN